MRYDLATNFDDDLIRRVSEFGVVKGVYGKLRQDVVGGGRPSFTLPDVSTRELQGHIQVAHEHGILFNYLLNALCTDNREFTSETNREIRDFVGFLGDSGVDYITVASPFLLRLVKERAPHIKVSCSVYNDIDSLDRVRAWEQFGADELTLHYSYNRNFRKLEQVLKSSSINFRLIANNVCLHECMYRTNHANALAHASQSAHESKGFFLDWFSLNCGREKLANPVKLISADWIRPEDVHFYEELCERLKTENLTLKLTDRSRSTDWLVNVVKAYANKSYDGNLFDILNYIGNGGYAQVHKGGFVKAAIAGKARAAKMLGLQKAVFLTPVYADNKSLDGFMDFFLTADCSQHTCDDKAWGDDYHKEEKPQNSCSYCRKWAEKVLQFPGGEKARTDAVERCERVLKDLETGEMFSK